VKGDSLEVKVNGSVVMRLSKLTSGGGVPMVKGKMGLQIEDPPTFGKILSISARP
jgi:hypothetical protein